MQHVRRCRLGLPEQLDDGRVPLHRDAQVVGLRIGGVLRGEGQLADPRIAAEADLVEGPGEHAVGGRADEQLQVRDLGQLAQGGHGSVASFVMISFTTR